MNIRQFFTIFVFIFSSLINTSIHCAGAPAEAPFPGFDPNMSEEELLNQLMSEINNALPEDQRDSFWEEVAKETERLEKETANMDEEEKEKYLLDLITAEPGQEVERPEPEAEIEEIEEEEALKAKPTPIKETKAISDVLKSLVKSIENFLDKAAAFPDFDGKVDRWAKQKRFTDWQEGQNWQTLKIELNKLVSRLERFKEKDPKIGMKHIDALLKNEPMMQNLKQFEAKLSREVPLIEMSVFAIEKMSNQTKNAITHTINALTEGLYRINLPEELLKILAEFDPAAKKILAAEEKAAKSALTQSKAYKPSRPARVAGKRDRSDGLSLPSLDDLGFSGYTPSRSGGGYRGGAGASGPQKSRSRGASQKGATDKKGAGKKGDGKKGSGGKDVDPDAPKKGKTTGIKNPNVKKHLDDFSKDLREAHNAVA